MPDFPINAQPHPRGWFAGIEWLRAVFITFVVAMHLNLAQILAGKVPHFLEKSTGFDLLLFDVFTSAVPGFLLISIFLQATKPQDAGRTRQHLRGVFFLYAFWVGSWVLLTRSRPEPTSWGVVRFALQGGGWAFYFFALLLLLHLQQVAIWKWSDRGLCLGFLGSTLLVIAGFSVMACNYHAWTRIDTYWWPICFMAIPFAGNWLGRHHEDLLGDPRRFRLWLFSFFGLALASALVEWSFAADAAELVMRPFLPEYLRLSPLFTALALILLALKVRSVPRCVGFLARNSLGIFCLHTFVLGRLYGEINKRVPDPAIAGGLTLIVVLILGAWITELVRKVLASRLI